MCTTGKAVGNMFFDADDTAVRNTHRKKFAARRIHFAALKDVPLERCLLVGHVESRALPARGRLLAGQRGVRLE